LLLPVRVTGRDGEGRATRNWCGMRCPCREQGGRGIDAGHDARGFSVTVAETGLRAAAVLVACCGLRPSPNCPAPQKTLFRPFRLHGACPCSSWPTRNPSRCWQFAPPCGAVALRGSAAQIGHGRRPRLRGSIALDRFWCNFGGGWIGEFSTDAPP